MSVHVYSMGNRHKFIVYMIQSQKHSHPDIQRLWYHIPTRARSRNVCLQSRGLPKMKTIISMPDLRGAEIAAETKEAEASQKPASHKEIQPPEETASPLKSPSRLPTSIPNLSSFCLRPSPQPHADPHRNAWNQPHPVLPPPHANLSKPYCIIHPGAWSNSYCTLLTTESDWLSQVFF